MRGRGEHSQRDHRGDGPDHGVLQDSKFAPEEQNPAGEGGTSEHLLVPGRMYGATVRALLLLSHGPRRAAAERRQVRLLLLDLQHEHQTGVLVAQEVQQKDQEVVDDVGLVALSARVHVDGQAGVAERQPLHKTGREAVLRARSCDTAPFQSTRACFHSNIM